MRRIDRILLAISQHHPGRVDLRAARLAPELGVEAFDVLALKRGGASTAVSHARVDGAALRVVVDGQAQALSPGLFPDELENTWVMRRGQPAQVLAEAAERIGAGLLLAAAHAGPRLPSWVRSSRNVELLRACGMPVLLVQGEARYDYRTVVVACDFSRAALASARIAALLAPRARFVFVHACALPEEAMMRELELPPRVIRAGREHACAVARRRLEDFVRLFLEEVAVPVCEAGLGRPHAVIADCARRHGADLLVLGRGALHPGAWLSCSNVMQRLVDEAPCDLLIGPGRQGGDCDRRLAA